jgi:hypothetical protein
VTRWLGAFLVVAIFAGAIAFFTLQSNFMERRLSLQIFPKATPRSLELRDLNEQRRHRILRWMI